MRVCHWLSLCILTSIFGTVAAQEPVPPDVTDGWKSYDKQLAHVKGTFKSTGTIRQGTTTDTQSSEVSFAFTSSGQRAEFSVTDQVSKVLIHRVIGVNSKYVFKLERGGTGWLLSEVIMLPNVAAQPLRSQLTALLSHVKSLVAVQGNGLAELQADLAVNRGPGGELGTLSLTKERRFVNGKNTTTYRKLSLQLDDSRYQLIKTVKGEMTVNKSSGTLDISISPRVIGGIPVPHRSTHREHYPSASGQAGTEVEITSETDYDIDPTVNLPESEFTLSAFGLPEPVGVVWEKRTPRYVWFLAIAGGCALFAFLFRRLARWRSAATPSRPKVT